MKLRTRGTLLALIALIFLVVACSTSAGPTTTVQTASGQGGTIWTHAGEVGNYTTVNDGVGHFQFRVRMEAFDTIFTVCNEPEQTCSEQETVIAREVIVETPSVPIAKASSTSLVVQCKDEPCTLTPTS